MSLRRFVHEQNAASAVGSPRSPTSSSASSPLSPPSTPAAGRRNSYVFSTPSATPSISSSTPFDWEAARSRRPPPYGTPLGKRAKASRKSELGTPAKRLVRKKGIFERITSFPSRVAFEISLFPHNVPLPKPNTSAWLLGGTLHFFHLCIRISQIRKVPDSDLGWEDMYREGEEEPWFDWTVPTTFLLIIISCLNAIYLFTRIKLYHLHSQADPVSSPHASFVPMHLDFAPLEPPSLFSRIHSALWSSFTAFWCFLFNTSLRSSSMGKGRLEQVQQLEVWTPGELEIKLFCVYSPVCPFLWMATTSANWMLMGFVMVAVGAQMHALTSSYEALLKDRKIITEEVMHEYNDKFVYPRVNPIRKDVAVMTHQSEMVNVWEDE